jgi:hypothetical protein
MDCDQRRDYSLIAKSSEHRWIAVINHRDENPRLKKALSTKASGDPLHRA